MAGGLTAGAGWAAAGVVAAATVAQQGAHGQDSGQ